MQQGLPFVLWVKKLSRNDQLWKLMSLPIWIGVRHHTPAAVVHAQQVRAQHWGGGGLLPRAVYLAWRFGKVPRSLNPTRMPPSQSHRLNLFPFVIPISCREVPALSKSNIPLKEKSRKKIKKTMSLRLLPCTDWGYHAHIEVTMYCTMYIIS